MAMAPCGSQTTRMSAPSSPPLRVPVPCLMACGPDVGAESGTAGRTGSVARPARSDGAAAEGAAAAGANCGIWAPREQVRGGYGIQAPGRRCGVVGDLGNGCVWWSGTWGAGVCGGWGFGERVCVVAGGARGGGPTPSRGRPSLALMQGPACSLHRPHGGTCSYQICQGWKPCGTLIGWLHFTRPFGPMHTITLTAMRCHASARHHRPVHSLPLHAWA